MGARLPVTDVYAKTNGSSFLSCPRAGATENARQQHGNAPAILLVGRAELGDQIPLLELQRDQDVGCGHDREQQMAGSHRRCGPECEQKTQHERMPHDFIEQGRLERLSRHLDAA